MSTSEYDVAIIGTGGAGCAAAMEAKNSGMEVCLITAGKFEESKTARAQGGIQAPFHPKDSPHTMSLDMLNAGNNRNDLELVETITNNATSTIEWLEELGVVFDKDASGNRLLSNAAGLTYPRILSCGDNSGNRIVGPLRRAVEQLDIPIYENYLVTDVCEIENHNYLISKTNNCETEDQYVSKDTYCISAGALVLTTGGTIARAKRAGSASVHKRNIGSDTLSLATLLKLKVENPELVQLHPTGILIPEELRRRPVPETCRSHGAYFLNKFGEEFVDNMGTRKLLSDSIIAECENGRGIEDGKGNVGVWLMTPEIDKKNGKGFLASKFNSIYCAMLEHGHDMSKVPVLVYPTAHYSLGGIVIDSRCNTSRPGVFAAGESTWGVHGEDRLMGNSLLEVFVFGRIAGQAAADFVVNKERSKHHG